MLLLGATILTGCAASSTTRPPSSTDAVRAELEVLRADIAAVVRASEEARAADRARVRAELEAQQARARDTEVEARRALAEIERLRARVEEVEARRRAAEPIPVSPPSPSSGPSSPVAPAPPERPSVMTQAQSAEQAYAAALATFRSGEHGQAILEFLAFIEDYPRHSLVPSARYWIADGYFAQRDYRQALGEFQRLLDQNGSGPTASEALLKTGLCFERLSDPRRAEVAWRRVVRDYPNSEAAVRARALLGRQGTSAR